MKNNFTAGGMITIISILFFMQGLQAQQQFLGSVKIEYEKSVNIKKTYEKRNIPDIFKENAPEYIKTYYDLLLNNNQSVYIKGRDPEIRGPWYREDDRRIYNNYSTGITETKKSIAWEDRYIKDSMPAINWKITPDTRTIAGFECRRATAVIFDSVFVVAFYTEEIMGSGGPESFGGLPGMILGLVIPRIHTTWYAQKVETSGIKTESIVPDKPGRRATVLTFPALKKEIANQTKSWDWEYPNNHPYIWGIMW